MLSVCLNSHPDAAIIATGDVNEANLRQVMPNFYQHISCPTRGENTLDHCDSQFRNVYKANLLLAFGKSDHAAIFLILEYKQMLVWVAPERRVVKHWSAQSEAALQDMRSMTWTGIYSSLVLLTSVSLWTV